MNVRNLKERIELNSEVRQDEQIKNYYHVENMWIWQNGFVMFSHDDFTITGVKFLQKNKKCQPKGK